MRYKLQDVIRKVEEDVQFGTCELCMYMGTHLYDVVVLEGEDGNKIEEEMGYWSWGDYFDYGLDNYVDFAAWLSKKDILGDFSVQELIMDYEEEKYDNESSGKQDYKEEVLDYR